MYWQFWRENDVTKCQPNFVFSIMRYLMILSKRSHHNFGNTVYAYPLKRYSVLKVQFSVILLLKIIIIAQNGRKFKFQNTISFEWLGIFLSNPHFIKNWHPLTLLNCHYKIATKAISNRIKSVILQLINK